MPHLTVHCLRCGQRFGVVIGNGQGAPPCCARCQAMTLDVHPHWRRVDAILAAARTWERAA